MTKQELQRVIADRDRQIANLTKMNGILRKLVMRLSQKTVPPNTQVEEEKPYRVH